MNEQKTLTEDELNSNPVLAMKVNTDTKLKEYLVEYVGTRLDQEDVTVNMIAEVLAADFPEFAFAYAEENFLRGYKQGLDDAQGLYSSFPEADDGTSQ